MAKKPTVTTLQSGFNSTDVLNQNFEALRDGFDNTLSLDGSTPNAMEADLDLNGNNIIGATGLLINGTDYLAEVESAKASALVAQAAAELAENNAETAEVNAEASETAAGLSATASASSATASASSASESALSAITAGGHSATSQQYAGFAQGYADVAQDYSGFADISADAAASSAAAAAASEAGVDADRVAAQAAAAAAASSESAAATSETNAATSETNAANSATSSASSATASANSATAASASESAASTSETNAAASAVTAASEATTATTQASNAATSATAAATSASNAATSETNAATSLTDAESARDQSQAARDTANLHKLAAEAAATSATNTAAALTGFDLEAIAESKAVTAVDVFVYDTSKDSDGGAWRKRTQGTSWYNETLNTATRGSRREFPAVAVIVAESNKVTIYDGDDPALPMWMVFGLNGGWSYIGFYSGTQITALTMKNGVMAVASNAAAGALIETNFIADAPPTIRVNSNSGTTAGNIAGRGTAYSFVTDASVGDIVNRVCNDVAMTVLPDAPIDPATGLPVPTIAVATAGGVSVIKDDGTVVDSQFNQASTAVSWSDGGTLWLNRTSTQGYYYATDFSSDPFSRSGFDNFTVPAIVPTQSATTVVTEVNDEVAGSNFGVSKLSFDAATPASSMVAYITSTYNTGWMNGDIKGAFLSDTDDTDLVGSGELVTNGDFATNDLTGWTVNAAATGKATVVGGELVYSTPHDDYAEVKQLNKSTVGTTYVYSFDVVDNTGVNAYVVIQVGRTQIYAGSISSLSIGTHTGTIVASHTDGFSISVRTDGEITIDNISIKLADADRSVNAQGLGVNGTVTRTPVATGADLVAYSGFSASNYLEAPYNSDLDFGTGDFCVMGWVKTSTIDDDFILNRSNGVNLNANWGVSFNDVNNGFLRFTAFNPTGSGLIILRGTTNAQTGAWVFFTVVRNSGVVSIFRDGVFEASASITYDLDSPSADHKITVGIDGGKTPSAALPGSLALLRISATAPTAEAIKKIYNDEKHLFTEGAQATLFGSSDAVTALAFDDSSQLLHVGTSAGRSVFQGLRRVSNTTTAVGTAISASNGLVVEE